MGSNRYEPYSDLVVKLLGILLYCEHFSPRINFMLYCRVILAELRLLLSTRI